MLSVSSTSGSQGNQSVSSFIGLAESREKWRKIKIFVPQSSLRSPLSNVKLYRLLPRVDLSLKIRGGMNIVHISNSSQEQMRKVGQVLVLVVESNFRLCNVGAML